MKFCPIFPVSIPIKFNAHHRVLSKSLAICLWENVLSFKKGRKRDLRKKQRVPATSLRLLTYLECFLHCLIVRDKIPWSNYIFILWQCGIQATYLSWYVTQKFSFLEYWSKQVCCGNCNCVVTSNLFLLFSTFEPEVACLGLWKQELLVHERNV